ncbi:hypothetical protein HC776_02675 [bacterium]|nr:hypothetical protein [bacterium]
MQIRFAYRWDNPEKTILRYTAKDGWTWRDYHACARIATLMLTPREPLIDVVIDLSSGGRLAAVLGAHSRTFGKRLSAALSGRAVVVGVSDEAVNTLLPDGTRLLPTEDGQVYFAASEADALAQLAAWREIQP